MILNLINKWSVNRKKSFMIGDNNSDKVAATKSKLFFEFSNKDFYVQVKKILNKFR